MLIMDQRTMQIKYRIPAAEIFKLSLSPYHDDIAVFHVRAVSILGFLKFIYSEKATKFEKHQLYVDHGSSNDANQVSDPRCRNIQIIP